MDQKILNHNSISNLHRDEVSNLPAISKNADDQIPYDEIIPDISQSLPRDGISSDLNTSLINVVLPRDGHTKVDFINPPILVAHNLIQDIVDPPSSKYTLPSYLKTQPPNIQVLEGYK